MEIILSNIIQIKNPTENILNYCKQSLNFKNPDFAKKQRMGFWLGKTPKYIKLYDYDSESIYLPIGCFEDIYKMYPDKSLYRDFGVVVERNLQSDIILRDYQEPCLNALKKHVNGVFVIPCSLGKTEIALACASYLQQKTLFIAHTNDLVKQAKDRCEDKMRVKTSLISDGKVDLSGDIVFATVQTLVKKLSEIPQNEFGLIVCDECHHISANAEAVGMFRICIDYFAARYKLGLTATLHRSDGLEACIPKLIGNVIYEIRQDGQDYVGIYENKEIIRFPIDKFQVPARVVFVPTKYAIFDEEQNIYRSVFDKNGMTISFSKLLTDISVDKKRNQLIIDLCKKTNGSIIVLSDRVEQLKILAKYLPDSVEIDGKTPKYDREKALNDIKDGRKRILLASYKLAKEGLDCKILSNIILATPIKDEAIVIQCIGRIQRPYPGKKEAFVFDLIDDVSTLNRFYSHRKRIYKTKGWLRSDEK